MNLKSVEDFVMGTSENISEQLVHAVGLAALTGLALALLLAWPAWLSLVLLLVGGQLVHPGRHWVWFGVGALAGCLVAFSPQMPPAHPARIAHSAVSGADECFYDGVPVAMGDSLPNGQRCYISHDPLHPGLLMFTPAPSAPAPARVQP